MRRALVSIVAVLGLLAAGCGSSSSSTTSTAAAPAGSSAGAGSAAPKFAFAGPAIASATGVRKGVVVSLSCQGAAGTQCQGREQLTTAKNLVVAETSFALAAGTTHLIGAPLNATGERLLKRSGNLPVTMTITLLNANPPTAIKTTATIR